MFSTHRGQFVIEIRYILESVEEWDDDEGVVISKRSLYKIEANTSSVANNQSRSIFAGLVDDSGGKCLR